MNTDLIPYRTITDLVETWRDTEEVIRTSFKMLDNASNNMCRVFEDSYIFNLQPDRHHGYKHPDVLISSLKVDVWRRLIDKMELKRLLSVKRAEELDKALSTGKLPDGSPLPDITEKGVFDLLRSFAMNVDKFIEDAVKEVFDFLRPRWGNQYKTNDKFVVGKRVIIPRTVERLWKSDDFRVSYHRQSQIRALDNVFHLLDGKGPVKSHYGPLYEAVETGPYETEYFSFKCFKNGNLHLTFKRLDLVEKLNKIAGGMNLKSEK